VPTPDLARITGEFMAYVLLFHEGPDAQRSSAPALRSHLLGLLDAALKAPEMQPIPADEVEEARFALVAWADEMVLRSSWVSTAEWLRDPLQLQLFRTNRAGDEFYDHLARLRPDQNQARQIYLLCLAFGFEGRFAGMPGERAQLVREQFELLRVSGRAADVATLSSLSPPAYEVAIELHGPGGRRLWPVLVGWTGFAVLVFGASWLALRWMASGVALPPGS
jgi:type VI secretion system protein ImpK